MIDLSGKRALVFGVASEDSIAWAIANKLSAHGVKVTLGTQKRFRSRVMQLLKGQDWVEKWLEADVTVEEEVEGFFGQLEGKYDMLVHAIAFAPGPALQQPLVKTKADDFAAALNVSSYSLIRLVDHALPHLNPGAGVLTLTYLGSTRHVPGYRVMGTAKAALEQIVRELAMDVGPQGGVRVNAISAGPIRTLAASGVPGFDKILGWMAHSTPLRRNVTQDDVANAAIFLLSPLAAGVTGEILYVDAGFHSVAVPPELETIELPAKTA
jgi:enoyl-[acyl-carrier protein] reductase I